MGRRRFKISGLRFQEEDSTRSRGILPLLAEAWGISGTVDALSRLLTQDLPGRLKTSGGRAG
jgi:hypothetical protein